MSLRRSAFLGSLLFLCMGLISTSVLAEPPQTPQRVKIGKKADASQNQSKVNINTADARELSTLKNIGKKRAELIVLDRETNGKFKSPQDLTRIKGIGDKTVKANLHRITVGNSANDAQPNQRGRNGAKNGAQPAGKLSQKLLNTGGKLGHKGMKKPKGSSKKAPRSKTQTQRPQPKVKELDRRKVD